MIQSFKGTFSYRKPVNEILSKIHELLIISELSAMNPQVNSEDNKM